MSAPSRRPAGRARPDLVPAPIGVTAPISVPAPTSRAITTSRFLDVGIVGAGRVGAALGAALVRAGHRVVGVSGFSPASVARIDRLLPQAPLLPPDRVPVGADLVLLCVPDDALAG